MEQVFAGGERAKRASLDEEENTRDESREMATYIMATSTTKLTLFHSIRSTPSSLGAGAVRLVLYGQREHGHSGRLGLHFGQFVARAVECGGHVHMQYAPSRDDHVRTPHPHFRIHRFSVRPPRTVTDRHHDARIYGGE